MKTTLKYKSFFAYSESSNKYFYTSFSEGINLVYGRNTSGKSTLIQAILYSFGINDLKTQLTEINKEKPIFRLDCELIKNKTIVKLIVIRDSENLYIKINNEIVQKFYGISGNNSEEHSKLKDYWNNLFGFTLQLQQKEEIVNASIETIFLPYYVSQSTGWVYLRKSFTGLEFYKNFKNDYLDYYLGIENGIDRIEKQKLIKRKEGYSNQIKFYIDFEKNNDDLVLTQIVDENFINKAKNYIEEFKNKQKELIEKEKEYIDYCNKLSFYNSRLSVLSMVRKNIKKQNPEKDICPTCNNKLKFSIEAVYNYQQDLSNTEDETSNINKQQKETQSKINSSQKRIIELKEMIINEYEIVKKYEEHKITFENWLNSKSNSQLIQNIELKLVKLNKELKDVDDNLEKYKTDKEIDELRNKKDIIFAKVFKENLKELDVDNESMQNDYKYTTLYKSSIFPLQGVELHKTVLAHNFAFNKIISNIEYIHRFPFLIDAIFKEDIDVDEKKRILNFVNKNAPTDTQLIISIAHKENENNSMIFNYNKSHFNGNANLICIGNGQNKRAFLSAYNNQHKEILEETLNLIQG